MINIIAAFNRRHVIGNDGQIPWILPGDLQKFKELTVGHPVIMGRKTHESLHRLLPGRRNIIVTRQENYIPVDVSDAVFVVSSLGQAIEIAQREDEEIFIIGGEEIYRQAIPLSDRMYLTYVFSNDEKGDASFPEFNLYNWQEVDFVVEQAFSFTTFERKRDSAK